MYALSSVRLKGRKLPHCRPDLLPSMGIAFGSALWGLFWIPVRAIEEAGISASWTGPTIFVCAVVVFLPFAIWHWQNFLASDFGFWMACGFAGIAFTLYAISFTLTDVVRAMLLFYMSPIWSTLLGILFLGERLALNRVLAIALGLGGLAVVLGGGDGFPWPRQIGDWFALGSGLCWSIASVHFFRGGATLILEKTFGFAICALGASVVLALLPLEIESAFPDVASLRQVWEWLVIVTAFLLPAFYLTIWPTTILSPARVGILFMFEAIAGVGSAAVLTEEPFGVREIVGTLLILSAGITEVIRPQSVMSGGRSDSSSQAE
jgi:drug/metabolite transporter (DMT)-like permease